eukprot:GDKH01019609.1.p1 GENE.GDKH01019609.1~~GDKH01019609.1.p1  ORF type:complete len:50 (+),score=7.16 GDKH01019609.1:137-286(+)
MSDQTNTNNHDDLFLNMLLTGGQIGDAVQEKTLDLQCSTELCQQLSITF